MQEESTGKIIIIAVKPWSAAFAERFYETHRTDWDIHVLTDENDVTAEKLASYNPRYVFFPHWSKYIPKEIYENFECIVFHPTDLPFGRGGTPIQNLIMQGHTQTVITAIHVNGELDGGDIYLKRPMSLLGGGEEILLRMSKVVFTDMMPEIISKNLKPIPQEGTSSIFKRRTPDMSELKPDMSIAQLFDMIRMLDIEGYPRAFISFGGYAIKFTRPSLTSNGICVNAEITKENPCDF